MNKPYPKLCQCPAKFAQGINPRQFFLDRWFRRGFVCGVLIHIYTHWDTVLPDITLETIHSRYCSLILIESAKYFSACIVYVAHQYTLRPSALKPVMMGTI